MRSLLDHDSDRGESAERVGQRISDLVLVAALIALFVWYFQVPLR